MNGTSAIQSSSVCGFNHMIHKLRDANFHDETDGTDLQNDTSKCFQVMDHYVEVCKGFVCLLKLVCRISFGPMV